MNSTPTTPTTPALFETPAFESSRAAALARMAAIRPGAYARTRNHLDGAVTGLSPYITHGWLTLREVLACVLQQGPLPVQHKLVFEFAWREYFRHVWLHEGAGIFDSLRPGVLPDAAYSRELPTDVQQACTGLPVIDQAVRTLVATGYLHNHARMWLASYLVHLRKVHWRTGADWMLGLLLDGDLASNHLSWQWVAATGSNKPYLFNAENVARYAPPEWHSKGTALDTGYETLEACARSTQVLSAETHRPAPIEAPGVFRDWPGASAPDFEKLRGRDVQIVHPWSLGLADAPAGHLRIGLLVDECHQPWPWSAARWQFVMQGLHATCEPGLVWRGSTAAWLQGLAVARSVQGRPDPHLPHRLNDALKTHEPATLLQWPAKRCKSFFEFWTLATRGLNQAAELLT